MGPDGSSRAARLAGYSERRPSRAETGAAAPGASASERKRRARGTNWMRWRRILTVHPLKTFALLAISAGSFGALAAAFVWTDTSEAVVIVAEPEAERPRERPAGSQARVRAEDVRAEDVRAEEEVQDSVRVEVPEAATPETEAAPAPEPTGVEVPEVVGRNSLRALRLARAAGLQVRIVDLDGERVMPEERLYVRVVEQDLSPGSRVEEGTTLRLRARYPRGAMVGGY